MKIGIVVTHPPKESMGSIVRVREFSRNLSKMNHEVHVISPFSFNENWGENVFFHQIKTFTGGSAFSEKMYSIARKILNVPYLSRLIMLRERTIRKIINSLSFSIYDFITSCKMELDIIQGEQEIAAAALVSIKEKLKIPVIADIHNIWPEELIVMGIIKRHDKRYNVLMSIESEIMSGADCIISVSNFMYDYLTKSFDVDKSKIHIVEPGGTLRREEPKERSKNPSAVYAGLVAYREHVDLFVKSMPYVLKRVPQAEFYITKKGEHLGKIQKLAKEINVSPHFFWIPNENEFFEFLASFYVGVVPSTKDLPRKMGTPVKLFDYMSVGIPVVANDIGSWSEIIRKENIGLLTEDDPKDFADAISYFLDDPDKSYKYGKRCIELIKNKYNWKFSTEKLIEVYKSILTKY